VDPTNTALVRYHFATTRSAVPVVACSACSRETVLSPAIVTENGLPGRCAHCGAGSITLATYRVEAGQVVRAP